MCQHVLLGSGPLFTSLYGKFYQGGSHLDFWDLQKGALVEQLDLGVPHRPSDGSQAILDVALSVVCSSFLALFLLFSCTIRAKLLQKQMIYGNCMKLHGLHHFFNLFAES